MIDRPASGTIPDAPGSYQFQDREGRVIYVGKAKSLRSRLNSYFVRSERLPVRTAQMVQEAESVEWISVGNELEALLLESTLIKEHRPRFNIELKDDKSYPLLAVTVKEEWPRPMVTRGRRRSGIRYFGPFGHVGAIRETLDLLLKTFPVRTCSDNKFSHHERLGRPCLLFHIEKCAGPCVGEISSEEYRGLVDDLVGFLDGNTAEVVERLQASMTAAAKTHEFEAAARSRDRLAAVGKVIERQQMVFQSAENIDLFGIWEDELEAAVQVFYVRAGRVVGRQGFIVDRVEDLNRSELMARIILEHYRSEPPRGIPKTILVPDLPKDQAVLSEWLSSERETQVGIKVPQRGGKRSLLETVTGNAREEFIRHRVKRSSDPNARAQALTELQVALELPQAPLRIECYDMSHFQGTDYVGSMVVMEDGLAKKADYRRFKIKEVRGNNDYAAMGEVLTRRLKAYLNELSKSASERPGRFAYAPNLLLVDGGRGQLRVAERALATFGLTGQIPVAALAKQFEEVYLPKRREPIRLPRGSEALYLLQRIRDESHRFAVQYHRQLRSKRMKRSVLDEVPGLGPKRKTRLLAEVGSIGAVQQAGLEDLEALPWLPNTVAKSIYESFHGSSESPSGD